MPFSVRKYTSEMICWVCIFVICFWPLVWIPFVMDSCYHNVLVCSQCRNHFWFLTNVGELLLRGWHFHANRNSEVCTFCYNFRHSRLIDSTDNEWTILRLNNTEDSVRDRWRSLEIGFLSNMLGLCLIFWGFV